MLHFWLRWLVRRRSTDGRRDWRIEHKGFEYFGYNHRGEYLVLKIAGIDAGSCTVFLRQVDRPSREWGIYYLELEPLEGVMLFAALAARPAASTSPGDSQL